MATDKISVILDVDGVLLKYSEGFFKRLKLDTGLDCKTWHEFSLKEPDLDRRLEVIHAYNSSDDFRWCPAILGAKEAIEWLQSMDDIALYAVTSSLSCEKSVVSRRENLFTEINWRQDDPIHMVGMGASKYDTLKSISPGVMIDDLPKNLAHARQAGHHGILFRLEEEKEPDDVGEFHRSWCDVISDIEVFLTNRRNIVLNKEDMKKSFTCEP